MSAVGDQSDVPTTGAGGVTVTRSEERLRVGTERRVSGRAVLRKYVVTETVTQTFQVRREEVRLEQLPLEADADGRDGQEPGLPGDRPEDDGTVVELVLHREVPRTQLAVVPYERVRLVRETVTEQVTVADQVRQERVVLEQAETPATTR